MNTALANFETALHAESDYPLLIRVGLAHAQFETIHPFLDGNGRMGRLLISFMLCEADVMNEPLLYLSVFFKEHRDVYYDRLQSVRDAGQWEEWLAFFLEGVATVAREATEKARRIVQLRETVRERVGASLGRRSGAGLRLLDALFKSPVVSVGMVQGILKYSQPAAAAMVAALERAGVLEEITGRRRDRLFAFQRYLRLFRDRGERG